MHACAACQVIEKNTSAALKKHHIPWIIIPGVLFLDQFTKVLVKTTMTLGQSIPVLGDWFIIHFTENYGMAFGMEFSGEFGKLLLSLFRILAVIFIGWYLAGLIKKSAPSGLIVFVSLILAGALGNIIDSSFYGLLFSESHYNRVAVFLPEGGGYSSFLHGKVVDMLYFPIIRTTLPEWLPWRGGESFIFFRPVFNLADTAITTGVFALIIFQKKFFGKTRTSGGKTGAQTVEALPSGPEQVLPEAEPVLGRENGGFLFEQIIFGPVKSRRLGISLGLNLLPLSLKHCSFNCLYCECGWTKPQGEDCLRYPSREDIAGALEERLQSMQLKKAMLDTITFAGNGEPTLHSDFPAIVDDTIALRDKYFPSAKVAVLSNASLAGKKEVKEALMKVELNILKLDAGTEETFRKINNPRISISLEELLENLKLFRGKMIIQSLFVRGSFQGEVFDNTTEEEVGAWLEHINMLQPSLVMIYPIARATPAENVEKVEFERLREIARKVEQLGIPTEVY